MGKKRKKGKSKKWKNSNWSKKQKKRQKKLKNLNKKYKSRRDALLDMFPKYEIELMFGDDEEAIKKFGNFLLKMDDLYDEDYNEPEGVSVYEEKIQKLKKKSVKDINGMIKNLHKIKKLEKKKKKNDKYASKIKNKDLSIASYLNDKKYKKKFLSKSKYKKQLKEYAKDERREMKEMVRLGYIKRNDPDKEIKRLSSSLKNANNNMEQALSDAYTQKHFLN